MADRHLRMDLPRATNEINGLELLVKNDFNLPRRLGLPFICKLNSNNVRMCVCTGREDPALEEFWPFPQCTCWISCRFLL